MKRILVAISFALLAVPAFAGNWPSPETWQVVQRIAQQSREAENRLIVAEKLAATLSGDAAVAPHETLSNRELEVLRLMARGASNQAIADQLVITVGTVKSHINHILGKLEAHNRTEAVARAREWGLLEI